MHLLIFLQPASSLLLQGLSTEKSLSSLFLISVFLLKSFQFFHGALVDVLYCRVLLLQASHLLSQTHYFLLQLPDRVSALDFPILLQAVYSSPQFMRILIFSALVSGQLLEVPISFFEVLLQLGGELKELLVFCLEPFVLQPQSFPLAPLPHQLLGIFLQSARAFYDILLYQSRRSLDLGIEDSTLTGHLRHLPCTFLHARQIIHNLHQNLLTLTLSPLPLLLPASPQLPILAPQFLYLLLSAVELRLEVAPLVVKIQCLCVQLGERVVESFCEGGSFCLVAHLNIMM